ncbi:MAG: hypothetical protein EPO09_09165 [Aquabacterium sp.]|uniref:hypothetical protein n=1 Tax=Aquabacterium sp. TaxID=1872578 RepID=UPI0012006BB6|nr:hypothetical protein [Aquabacterium sp.]TAK94686.1 MAG: hypothetical protein EPO09_09165 [Aquabacterium sp.]
MRIELPGIRDQQAFIFQQATDQAIRQLKANLEAPRLPPQQYVTEQDFPRSHLLRESEGWEAPPAELVRAYFKHFQDHFPAYNTDGKLAALLGLSSDRRVREFKEGGRKVPYGVWRHFLVITGRVPQDVLPVLAYMA